VNVSPETPETTTPGADAQATAAGVTSLPPSLEVRDVSKSFGSFQALDHVSLEVRPGTVHALLGENGAGKSTLVKCIMGYHRADSGKILLGGQAVTPRNPRDAQRLGIGMVYQHFTLVPNMTVAENLVLSRPDQPFVFDWKAEHARLEVFLQKMPFRVPLDVPVSSLAAGEKQKLEILKQLYLDSRLVILDEPTSVLTPGEADEVLGLLAGMARSGQISILMITHNFREVKAFADEVTVLRRGRQTGRGLVSELDAPRMAEMMVGTSTPTERASVRATEIGDIRLRLDALSALDDQGLPALEEVSFDVRSGEIVGIAAVAGNGQEELVEVLAGQREKSTGTVYVHRDPYDATREEIRRHSFRCLPEDPLRNACVATMSVAENLAFHVFDRVPFARARWFVSPKAMSEVAERRIGEYGIRAPSGQSPIGHLSGGNVQRVVLARELSEKVDVLVVANPCMGLDFKAVGEIHDRIRQARDTGAAVLLVSADLDEVFALADRVLVMSEGRIVFDRPVGESALATVGAHMAGHA